MSHGPHLSVASPVFPLMGVYPVPNSVFPVSLDVRVKESEARTKS